MLAFGRRIGNRAVRMTRSTQGAGFVPCFLFLVYALSGIFVGLLLFWRKVDKVFCFTRSFVHVWKDSDKKKREKKKGLGHIIPR